MSLGAFLSISRAKRRIIFLALTSVFVVASLPIFALSSQETKIYVKAGASGPEDGSQANPYHTINEAMLHADKNTEIHVANGTYKENILVKKGVEIFGESRDKTIIKAKDDDKAVIKLKDGTKINKLTLKDGKYGVIVEGKAKASIINCVIKRNDKHGIWIEDDGVSRARMVSISKNSIKDNGRAGIFSERHRLSITDNDITGNDKDGIDILEKSTAWIEDNDIKDNGGSGLKLRIDGSNIWTKNNDIKDNEREGVEVSFWGGSGRINISKSDISENGRYGLAKVQRASVGNSAALWNKYLTFDGKNRFSGNDDGQVSGIFRAY